MKERPCLHGHRFDFKELATWLPPDETVWQEHPTYGSVRLRRWEGLHDRQAPMLSITIVLAEIHLERDQPPEGLWLAYYGPPAATPIIWGWYLQRWPIEPAIRFCKQRLYWTLPRLQQDVRCDRWTALVDIAYWHIWLVRHLVADCPLPWQKSQSALKPERILAGTNVILATLPVVTTPVQPRGKSPGWSPGRHRRRLPRFPPVKRGRKRQ